ncbi:MAG: hypothetical protein JRI23_33225 [Deltaproteobacteria bacterium]|jgi:hypothetical protein|nr:hypothetical protein [Deltaproteobacteria bacterium]MBW2537134.1 hypothetical protein [Deltaproteobacteria bacterium]
MSDLKVITLSFGTLCLLIGTTGCNPCDKLEERICNDLGEADCKAWKEAGGPDTLRSGRRPKRSCTNALGNYDPHLKGAKAIASAQRQVPAAAKKAAQPSADEPAGDPPKPAEQGESCKKLEEKVCGELGDACAGWKEKGKAGVADRNELQCKMALDKDLFYKKVIEAAKGASQ